MNSWRKIGVGLLPIALMSALIVVGSTSAQAAEGDELPCVAAAAYDETVVDQVAHDETVVDTEAYDVKVIDTPGQAAVPGIPAVYEIEYKFVHFADDELQTHWDTNQNWNANDNENSDGWVSTDETRDGDLITAASLGTDAVEEVSHFVHHDAVTHVVTHDAVTHVVHHDAVVCVDGDPVIGDGIKPAVDSVSPDEVDPVSAATLPDTGGLSLGWLSLGGLLIVAGTVVLARRRTA